MTEYLSTNRNCLLWRQDYQGNVRPAGAYIAGMVGYAFSIVTRTIYVAIRAIVMVARFFIAVGSTLFWYGDVKQKWKDLGVSVLTFGGSLLELANTGVGTICPPLAYKIDEWLYQRGGVMEHNAFITKWVEPVDVRLAPLAPWPSPDGDDALERAQIALIELFEQHEQEEREAQLASQCARFKKAARRAFTTMKREGVLPKTSDSDDVLSLEDVAIYYGETQKVCSAAVVAAMLQGGKGGVLRRTVLAIYDQKAEYAQLRQQRAVIARALQRQYGGNVPPGQLVELADVDGQLRLFEAEKARLEAGIQDAESKLSEVSLESCIQHLANYRPNPAVPIDPAVASFAEAVKEVGVKLATALRQDWEALWRPFFQKVFMP
ncbi:MAG: hypothetical protein H7A36_02845 [Chlamydiales bacterium]|nr:hypothetical protein [Chlamydiales bacterium]